MGINDFLKEYTPEAEKDNFGPIKGTFTCVVNHARFEDYTGENADWKGVKFYRYELEVAEGQECAGRRLWKSVPLNDEGRVKKLANILFTVGLEFTTEEELEKVSEEFSKMSLTVKAWSFKPKDAKEGDEPIQVHMIKGIADGVATKKESEVPF